MSDFSAAFGTVAGVLALASFLILVTERVTEFVLRPVLVGLAKLAGKREEDVSPLLPYVAGGLGAALSFGFGLDLFGPLAAAVGLHPAAWVTTGLTALVVAGGSNLLHDLWPESEPGVGE